MSKGDEETTTVPDVTGSSVTDALTALNNANLKFTLKYEYHDTIGKDKVISQDVEKDTEVSIGTSVVLVISLGQEPTTSAPTESTEAPEQTTEAPEETTEAPEQTTEVPEQTAEAPEETTEASETTDPLSNSETEESTEESTGTTE